jgi:hypothetical protein
MADDNWLDAAVIACPNCGIRLFRVIHSPFCDDHRLYCDNCPRAIEISYYDANYSRILNSLGQDQTAASRREQIMAAMEPLLKACKCGGRFRDTSPRHCFTCGAVVPEAATHDLSRYTGCEDSGREPTREEEAVYHSFEADFIGREDLWA